MDPPVRAEPSASRQPPLPQRRHPLDRPVAAAVRGPDLPAPPVAAPHRALRGGMDLPVRGSRLRGQAPRVPAGLALPVRGAALVAGQDARPGLRPRLAGPTEI